MELDKIQRRIVRLYGREGFDEQRMTSSLIGLTNRCVEEFFLAKSILLCCVNCGEPFNKTDLMENSGEAMFYCQPCQKPSPIKPVKALPYIKEQISRAFREGKL